MNYMETAQELHIFVQPQTAARVKKDCPAVEVLGSGTAGAGDTAHSFRLGKTSIYRMSHEYIVFLLYQKIPRCQL